MGRLLDIATRNAVLTRMAGLVAIRREEILKANRDDLANYAAGDRALYDRLKLDVPKIEGMIQALEQLAGQPDPLGVEKYHFVHSNGLEISNRTAAFGTVLIIYESRPDVTIEAAGIAMKSGNRILLKGGKEARKSNLLLTACWHEALRKENVVTTWVQYLDYSREETLEFLRNPTEKVDLVVPRGGQQLISFVREHANCPVIVSGRGNNFLYVDEEADPEMAIELILNAKTTKISACNALDKVLIHEDLPGKEVFIKQLIANLREKDVSILADNKLAVYDECTEIQEERIWFEEFLDYKIVLGSVKNMEEAIGMINKYSGGHSATIVSRNKVCAQLFMEEVDAAAVYHNASTRFTDGGQFGLGGELAISTDKLHQRGPLGLQHLTTNKWYVGGAGQVRNEKA